MDRHERLSTALSGRAGRQGDGASGYMDVNRISGYIPGKMVFFLMQASRDLPRPSSLWSSSPPERAGLGRTPLQLP